MARPRFGRSSRQHHARTGADCGIYPERAPAMSAQHAGQMPRGTDHRRRFTVLDAAALLALPPPEYLVEDVLVQDTLAVLYSPAGAGKSFGALDLALSIATGTPWQGRAVKSGAVVYIAAEGGAGLGQRVRAWMTKHQVARIDNAWFVLGAVNLLDEDEVTAFLAELSEVAVKPLLLIADTLARCLVGGDENSAKDMGIAVAALDRLREALGCTALVLHHTAATTTASEAPRRSVGPPTRWPRIAKSRTCLFRLSREYPPRPVIWAPGAQN